MNINQKGLVQNDTPLVHPSSKVMPQSIGEVEGEKVSSRLGDIDCLKNSVIRGERNVEWKNVQPFLTEMGLQLIQDPKKTNLSRNSFKARRKKGSRKLQNLEFNVNYDRSDCSRGKRLLP